MLSHTYLDVAVRNDNFPYEPEIIDDFYLLKLPHDTRTFGLIPQEVAKKLPWTSRFSISHSAPLTVQVLDASEGRDAAGSCNTAFSELIGAAISADLFAVIHGSHSEPFLIPGTLYPEPVHVERYAAPLFGIVHRGAHATAYMLTPSGIKIWVARRSPHIKVAPGMLDTTVAGGIKAGQTPAETIVAEAGEEASLPADLVRANLKAAGALTYLQKTTFGFKGEEFVVPDIVYAYDLELDQSVIPKPGDEEVEGFYLMDVEQCRMAIFRGEFKPNCAVVMVDFFMRHGIITPENEKNYVEIATRMHRKLPFPTDPASS